MIGAIAAVSVFVIGAQCLKGPVFNGDWRADHFLVTEAAVGPGGANHNCLEVSEIIALMTLGTGLILLAAKRQTLAHCCGFGVCVSQLFPTVARWREFNEFYRPSELFVGDWSSVVPLAALGFGLLHTPPHDDDAFISVRLRQNRGAMLVSRLLPAILLTPLLPAVLPLPAQEHCLVNPGFGTRKVVIVLLVMSVALVCLSVKTTRSRRGCPVQQR